MIRDECLLHGRVCAIVSILSKKNYKKERKESPRS